MINSENAFTFLRNLTHNLDTNIDLKFYENFMFYKHNNDSDTKVFAINDFISYSSVMHLS